MIWLIALLIPMTALMMGSVDPWAFKAMEESVLALGIVWIVRVALGSCTWPIINRKLRLPLIGLLLLLSTVALQLVPLPIQVERLISPSTYHLYEISLPGWPEKVPYSWLQQSRLFREDLIKAPGAAREGSKQTFPTEMEHFAAEGTKVRDGRILFPLSVAPSLTKGGLFKLLTSFLLGVMIILYPFPEGNHGRKNVYQVLARVILATGLLVSFVGLLEEFISNGKPLWIWTPYSLKGQEVWAGRAFGPFANPDHYACFLAMLLPPAIGGMLFPGMLGKVRERAAVPLLCGVIAVVIVSALLATASRGGILNAAVGIAVLVLLSYRLPAERRPPIFRSRRRSLVILTAGAAGLLSSAIVLAGNSNRTLADSRLRAPFGDESVAARFIPSLDTVQMISDFPILGIGLGAWPDLYRRYTRPPWSPVFMNAAHDEYVQFLAETGAIGFLLAATIVLVIGREISYKIFSLPTSEFAIIASFVASLAGLALHAALDFPLRIPAIAMLATIMCAAVLRAVFQDQPSPKIRLEFIGKGSLGAIGVAALLAVLMWLVTLQPKAPYPYDLKAAANGRQMVGQLFAHPANSRVHLSLIASMNADMPIERLMEELRLTVMLEPNNPIARDIYLQVLARTGHNGAALDEMASSVFYAPSASDHFYLNADWVPKLTAPERDAIETGLRKAVRNRFEGAVTTLDGYYEELGDFRKAGDLLTQAARTTDSLETQSQLLSRAGCAFAKAGDYEGATDVFQEAINLRPEYSDPYQYLGLEVNVPRGQFDNARLIINRGIKAGADSAKLYLALAEVNRAANDKAGEEEALKKAVALEPFNFQITYALAVALLTDGHTDQAILWLKQASQLDPTSAEAFFQLAQAEESAYQFLAAQTDYTKALALEPGNIAMQSRFEQFKERVAATNGSN
jgi:tetratricopeptide (TPR) repeat protein